MRLKMLDDYHTQIAPMMNMARNFAPMPDFDREINHPVYGRSPMSIPHPPKPITITSTITLDLDDLDDRIPDEG